MKLKKGIDKMKRRSEMMCLLSLIFVNLVFCSSQFAYGYTCVKNGVKWEYGLNYGTTAVIFSIPKETSGTLVVPSTLDGYPVIKIGYQAFCGCTNLTSVKISYGIEILGESSFDSCRSLKYVEIPESVKSIGNYCFAGCTFEEIKIPKSVTSIGTWAFMGCRSLKRIDIPDGVTWLNALYNCSSLTEVNLPSSLTMLGDTAFYKCTSLEKISLSSVLSVSGEAFMGCTKLKDVELSSKLQSISYSMFMYCSALENIFLPESVKTISKEAFCFCTSLKRIVIPSNVTTIGQEAFYGCSSLSEVFFEGPPPTSAGANIFLSTAPNSIGFYNKKYENEWKGVVDSNGMWRGLRMRQEFKSPINLRATQYRDLYPTGVLLTWSPVDGALGYAVFRCQKDGKEELISFVKGCEYLDDVRKMGDCKELNADYYVVVAEKESDGTVIALSRKSDTVEGSWRAPVLTTTTDREDGIRLTWEGMGDIVYRSLSENGPYSIIAKNLYQHTYDDISCMPGVRYHYQVGYETSGIDGDGKVIRSDVIIGKRVVKTVEPKLHFALKGIVPATEGLSREKDILVAGKSFTCTITNKDANADYRIKSVRLIGSPVNGTPARKSHKIFCVAQSQVTDIFAPTIPRPLGDNDWVDGSVVQNTGDVFEFVATLRFGSGYHGKYAWAVHCEYEVNGKTFDKNIPGVNKNVYFIKKGVDKDGTTPNWYTYWKDDGACPSLTNVNVSYRGLPDLCGAADGSHVYIDRDAAELDVTHDTILELQKSILGRHDLPKYLFGIYTVEATVTHEVQHNKTYKRYDSQIKIGKRDQDKSEYECAVETGYGLCVFYSENDRFEKCDRIVDDDEDNGVVVEGDKNSVKICNLLKTNVDTFNLRSIEGISGKWWNYGGYGDDEFVSRIAERFGADNARPQNDWSYPGELAGDLPNEVLMSPSYHKTRSLKSAIQQSNTNLVISINSINATTDRDQENCITGIVYTIGVNIRGRECVRFEGSLVDSQSNLVATALSAAIAESESVALFFDSRNIFDNYNGGSLTLGRVDLTIDGNYSTNSVIGTLYDFAVEPIEVNKSELLCNKGYILDGATTNDVSALGIAVSIPVLVNVADDYRLEAELVSTNGDLVATATASNTCAVGTNTFALVFSNDSIFQSGVDGFNAVKNLKLWFGDELIDADAGPFELPTTYSHADFLPTNSYVTIDLTSEGFLDPDIAADGKLSSLKFYFDVTNGTGETLCYDVSALLFGTDTELVASVSSKINVTNGVNHVEIVIPASSIAASNIDGPYWFRTVELQSQNENVCGATFWPKSQSGAYKASDFGNVAFEISGMPEVVELVDYDRLSLEYSYDATRTGEIVVEAVLVDKNGDFVARVVNTNDVEEIGIKTNTITITCRDITGEDAGAPYAIANISFRAGIDGEKPIYANTEGLTNIYWRTARCFVDANAGSDSNDGRSWDQAYKTISYAIPFANSNNTIAVKPGVYSGFTTGNRAITITAVDGNSTTVIDGGGTNCCVYAYTNNVSISVMTNTVVVGFTIRNGYALQGGAAYGGTLCECVIVSNTATRYGGGTYYGVQYGCTYRDNSVDGTLVARGGAAYFGKSYNCIYENNMVNGVSSSDGGAIFGGVRYDCLIKNNVSNTRGGGVAQATCYRCVLTGNSAKTGGGSYSGTLRDCLIAENEAVGNGGGSYGSTLIGCTVVKNIAGDAGGVVAGVARNSIIWGNSVTNGVSTNCVSTTLQYSCTDSISGEIGCIIEDPQFVDVENGDYRLLHGSPCIDAGNNSFLVALSTCDIAQKDRVLNRIVDMGCYEGAFLPNAETQSTPKPVPHIWLDSLGILSSFGGDYEAMANAPSPGASGSGKIWPNGSPCYVWEDFVAGTSPTNDAVFTATIRMDGDTPVITWEPDTLELRATRVYRIYGKKTLMDANWTDITDKDMSEYHFFKVTVDLP